LRRYVVPAAVGVAALIAVALVIPSVHQKITTRVNQIGTVQERQALDAAAVKMVEARPLFGFGWGRFIQVAPDYFVTSNSYTIQGVANNPVHDVYASIAAELGLIGLALWLAVLFGGVGGAVVSGRAPPDVRPWRIALGSIFVLWLAAGLSSPLGTSFQSTIIWLWAAVVVGAGLRGKELMRPTTEAVPPPRGSDTTLAPPVASAGARRTRRRARRWVVQE
jgi:O-antigen ligase